MHLIATTLAFLIIFAIYSFTQLQNFKENLFVESIYTQQIEQKAIKLSKSIDKRAKSIFHRLFSKAQVPQTIHSKRTSYLHIQSLFETRAPQNKSAADTAKIIFMRLMINLYQNQPFYQEAKKSVPDLEEQLLQQLQKQAKLLVNKEAFHSKEDLASLPLDNDLYQTVLYKMLKGNIPQDLTDPPANGEYYKSLCDFIQISNTKSPYIMSIYLAPRELLLALFQNEKTVKKVLAKRNEIHEALKEKEREEKKTGIKSDNTPFRTEKSQILRDTVIKMLPLNFDINFIDFGVSSSNPEDYE